MKSGDLVNSSALDFGDAHTPPWAMAYHYGTGLHIEVKGAPDLPREPTLPPQPWVGTKPLNLGSLHGSPPRIINAEKSEFNEDQAACGKLCIRRYEFGAEEDQEWLTLCTEEFLTGHYWALFDGHGGPAAAILAANTLHSCLRRQLEAVVEGIVTTQPPMHLSGHCVCLSDPQFVEEKGIKTKDLVIGALECAFQECDEVIGRELEASCQVGGCTALVAVFLQGKLYVANAGDSRALLVRRDEIRPLSSEFTPETERQRIQQLAFVYPELLAGEFTRLEFPRRLKGDDLGQKVLFRDHYMNGWSYKCVEKSDLKYPLIHGQGRQARLLGTLAVSRGLGDHQLRVLDTNIQLKPFLLSVPEVTVLDMDQLELQEDDVVVMATDGLWDVLSNEQVAWLVRSFLPGNRDDPHRFLELAQMLIRSTQGKEDGPTVQGQVSYDDVSVFVIPLHSQGQGGSGP
ncbi:protein phosphatase 1M isoform X1 [Fukomys damarensis]|uniref:Protein phosphatase 1M n=1 Tax=Fukomys damarensis TaxID=885580 RepID=A0A091DQH0_FUKDA|nr:protein phosphatase 1M isoform X1 [Fukomys damarensis]KFO32693.1 Protein phosphatase 1M [Fukomys damarensis]